MPLVHMKPMLKTAKAARYGIAAFNMIDFNSARAIVDGAQELNAPIIIQVSVKTIKLWSHKTLGSWVAALAADADVPVALHLDHCKDLDVIKGCIDNGWTSVMFDGSADPFEENVRKSKQAYDIAMAAGVGLEAELGAIGGVEDDKFVAEDEAILADVDECLAFCKEMPELAVFAPAIGTAHGDYKGEPKIAYDRLEKLTSIIDIPIALHGGTGLTDEQFTRCIQSGCAKVNISTMHKKHFVDGFCDLKKKEPPVKEPIPYIEAQYETMKAGVTDMIRTFGSEGKASQMKAA
ncbi:class II fructose-bisphosphate aldolase [Rhodobium gokarnense]|uniref:Ketose-bisphosphate aldolase n=1 Tax=Rhodobium gokarnense TaxID=364296 RepID=A0ABT3H883_9HYPH|nr:class II fructose-bisphosphate aldolase [Rhodobium gokarnense]MCW2306591.1 ketose-bisphosphate aldolase [Rhodobium gokarnense]